MSTAYGHGTKRRAVALCAAGLVTLPAGPALADHLFTQAANNTPTWIQSGQGVRIAQTSMASSYSMGTISFNFAANPTTPDGADTSDNTWWAWSAGDVLRFTVPTVDGDLSTAIAFDAATDCTPHDICGNNSSSSRSARPFP